MLGAPCRKRSNVVMPRAENFGDLITADHKALSEESESRNNHRCAVVVQDLATQWLQSHTCNTKTSQETQKSSMKFLEPTRKPKVIYTENSLEFGKSCEELSWNHCLVLGKDFLRIWQSFDFFCRICTSSAVCCLRAPSVAILTPLRPAVHPLLGCSSGKPIQDQLVWRFVL